MNAFTEAESIALAKVDQKRLRRLAELAGRSPRASHFFGRLVRYGLILHARSAGTCRHSPGGPDALS